MGRRAVSALYKLLTLASPDSLCHIKHQWEKDLGVSVTKAQWESILKNTTASSKCVRYTTIQFKVLRRAYITPNRLNKTDLSLF